MRSRYLRNSRPRCAGAGAGFSASTEEGASIGLGVKAGHCITWQRAPVPGGRRAMRSA
jgi:hypothetical protein